MVCCSSGHGDQLPGYTDQASSRMQALVSDPRPERLESGEGEQRGAGKHEPQHLFHSLAV